MRRGSWRSSSTPRWRERLRERVPANVEIVTADALRADLRALVPEGSRVAGNLPYYVSSPLLRRFLDLRDHVRDVHVMLQDEVARRIAVPPGSKEYGILSVLFALWADVDIPARFPPGAFAAPAQGRLGRPARPLPRPSRGPRSADLRGLREVRANGLRSPSQDP